MNGNQKKERPLQAGPLGRLVMKEVAFESGPWRAEGEPGFQWLGGKHPPATQQMQWSKCVPHGRDLVIKQAKVEERAPGRRKGPLLRQ